MSELLTSPGVGVIFALGIAVALGIIAACTIDLANERAHTRAHLRHVDDLYDLADVGTPDPMLAPLVERVVGPARAGLLRLGARVSPADYLTRMRAMMARAGRLDPRAADQFLSVRLLGMISAPVLFLVTYAVLPLPGNVRVMAGGVMAAAVLVLPKSRLDRAVQEREALIRQQLPSVMDLLVVCVEAGLGFSTALTRTVAAVPGELSNEFAIALGEMRAGSSRSDALGRLADRVTIPEIRSFVSALRQAEHLGISIAPVLREQANDMRVRRRQLAQEKAQKAPVKMLIPMVFCIFPPLFMVVIGPAGLQLVYGGGLK